MIKLKNMFRRHCGKIEVWDTSAIRTWFDKFVEHVNKDGINVIVPEGVRHELSAKRHEIKECRDAYDFIAKAKKDGKLTVYINKIYMYACVIDMQVVLIAYEYYRKGYNTTLVTCDCDMKDRAVDRSVPVELLHGNRNDVQQQVHIVNDVKPQQEFLEGASTDQTVESQFDECEGESVIPCELINKVPYVNTRTVAVYDYRGKKKIGANSKVAVTEKDIILYRGDRYMLKDVKPRFILLKRMDSA